MFSPLPNRRSLAGSTWLSIAAHAVAGAVFLFSMRLHPVHVFSLPGTALGTRVEIAYLPGRAPAPALHAQKKIKPRARSAPEISALSRTSGVYAAARRQSIRRRFRTLPSPRLHPPQYFRTRVRYAGLNHRLRLVGLGLDPDSSHHLLPQPGARSLGPAPWRTGGCGGRCHHRP